MLAYEANLAYATMLSEQLNSIVPGISRGIIKKSGTGVNGVYNQDLATNVLLIEFGGIDNTRRRTSTNDGGFSAGDSGCFC